MAQTLHERKIAGLLKTRQRAADAGDVSVARACTVELGYLGFTDPEPESPMENTAAAPLPEKTTRRSPAPTRKKTRSR